MTRACRIGSYIIIPGNVLSVLFLLHPVWCAAAVAALSKPDGLWNDSFKMALSNAVRSFDAKANGRASAKVIYMAKVKTCSTVVLVFCRLISFCYERLTCWG